MLRQSHLLKCVQIRKSKKLDSDVKPKVTSKRIAEVFLERTERITRKTRAQNECDDAENDLQESPPHKPQHEVDVQAIGTLSQFQDGQMNAILTKINAEPLKY